MKKIILSFTFLSSFAIASIQTVVAQTLPFDLSISGDSFAVNKSLQLSDLGEGKTTINFSFKDKQGNDYVFDLKYKKLASNRSFPGNLDITIKNSQGEKQGYLFFAINGVDFLKQMGKFGLIIDIQGKPVDIEFLFDANKKGQLRVAQLENERFVQDTLVPKFSFQMIRPVLIPQVKTGFRSQSYALDNHPFLVNYTLKDLDNGLVQFQYNLYKNENNQSHLLERIYFNADSLKTLREAMFAGKYFDKDAGTFKLVFYPTMGQTSPVKQ